MAIGYKHAINNEGEAKAMKVQLINVAAVPINISGQPNVDCKLARKQPSVIPIIKSGLKKHNRPRISAILTWIVPKEMLWSKKQSKK